jgi:hypothetical protein
MLSIFAIYILSKSFQRCGAFVNLIYIIKHTVFLNKSVKNNKDTQHLLITIIVRQIEAHNYGKLTISWDNSILPSYCALKTSKYVSSGVATPII